MILAIVFGSHIKRIRNDSYCNDSRIDKNPSMPLYQRHANFYICARDEGYANFPGQWALPTIPLGLRSPNSR